MMTTRFGARWTEVRDAHGNRVKTSTFGVDGAPVDRSEGWSVEAVKVDARGRAVEYSRTKADGTPARVARWKLSYDAKSRITMLTFFEPNGALTETGIAYETRSYDDRDNQIDVRFLDKNNHPVLGDGGFAEIRTRYNDDDQPTEKSYLGVDGRLVAPLNGEARTVYTYDTAGKLERTEYFDALGAPSEKLGARHLLVMYSGSMRASAGITRTKEEARLHAEEAKKKIAGGMPFEAAVKLYSDEPGASARGGDLGSFKRGQMVKEFETVVLATPVGQVSGVFETPFGFHVLERTR